MKSTLRIKTNKGTSPVKEIKASMNIKKRRGTPSTKDILEFFKTVAALNKSLGGEFFFLPFVGDKRNLNKDISCWTCKHAHFLHPDRKPVGGFVCDVLQFESIEKEMHILNYLSCFKYQENYSNNAVDFIMN